MKTLLTMTKRSALVLAFITVILAIGFINTRSGDAAAPCPTLTSSFTSQTGDAVTIDNSHKFTIYQVSANIGGGKDNWLSTVIFDIDLTNPNYSGLSTKFTTPTFNLLTTEGNDGNTTIAMSGDISIEIIINNSSIGTLAAHYERAAGGGVTYSPHEYILGTDIVGAETGRPTFYTAVNDPPVEADLTPYIGQHVAAKFVIKGTYFSGDPRLAMSSLATLTFGLTCDTACTAQAGTITTDTTSGIPGSTVTVTGAGWQAGTGNFYRIALDGAPVPNAPVQTPASCTEQPNIMFDIPCPTPPGTYQLTCQLVNSSTQQVVAESSPPIDFTVTAPTARTALTSACATVYFEEAPSVPAAEPIGVPMSNGNKHRKRTLRLVSFTIPAQDIDIFGSSQLKISNVNVISSTTLTFDVEGLTVSDPLTPGDASITAVSRIKPRGSLATARVSVVIPVQIATPHDVTGVPAPPRRVALNEDSIPPAPGVPKNQYLLGTAYYTNLTVRILDQYGNSLEDLYQGAQIYEDYFVRGPTPTGIFLRQDSTYLDPVGPVEPRDGFDNIVKSITKSKQERDAWLDGTPGPFFENGLFRNPQNFRVYVDEFPVVPDVVRGFQVQNPPFMLKIIWP